MASAASDEDQLGVLKTNLESDISTLLRLTFTNGPPTDGDIRASSVILRKWLNGSLLQRLSRLTGLHPTFPVLQNDVPLSAIPNDASVNYFLTGGVRFSGQPVMGIYNSSRPIAAAPVFPAHDMSIVMMSPKDMLRQRRVYFDGTYFSCEDIISFTANKLGGAHLDFDRPGRHAIMDAASKFMTFGGPLERVGGKPPGEVYLALEPSGREILSGFHIEVLATAASFVQLHWNGQAFVDIRSTLRPTLVSKLRRLLGLRPRLSVILYDLAADTESERRPN